MFSSSFSCNINFRADGVYFTALNKDISSAWPRHKRACALDTSLMLNFDVREVCCHDTTVQVLYARPRIRTVSALFWELFGVGVLCIRSRPIAYLSLFSFPNLLFVSCFKFEQTSRLTVILRRKYINS